MRVQTLNSAPFAALFLILALIPATTHVVSRGFPVVVAHNWSGNCGHARVVIVEVLQGGFRLNVEDVKIGQLESQLYNIFKTRVERVVFVRADPEVSFRRVAEVIDVAMRQVDYVAIVPRSVNVGINSCLTISVKPEEYYHHRDRLER